MKGAAGRAGSLAATLAMVLAGGNAFATGAGQDAADGAEQAQATIAQARSMLDAAAPAQRAPEPAPGANYVPESSELARTRAASPAPLPDVGSGQGPLPA